MLPMSRRKLLPQQAASLDASLSVYIVETLLLNTVFSHQNYHIGDQIWNSSEVLIKVVWLTPSMFQYSSYILMNI